MKQMNGFFQIYIGTLTVEGLSDVLKWIDERMKQLEEEDSIPSPPSNKYSAERPDTPPPSQSKQRQPFSNPHNGPVE